MTTATPPAVVQECFRRLEEEGFDVGLLVLVRDLKIQNTNPMKFHSGEVEVFSFAHVTDEYLRDSVVRGALRVARERLVARVAGTEPGHGGIEGTGR
jgi:hypothetical protein